MDFPETAAAGLMRSASSGEASATGGLFSRVLLIQIRMQARGMETTGSREAYLSTFDIDWMRRVCLRACECRRLAARADWRGVCYRRLGTDDVSCHVLPLCADTRGSVPVGRKPLHLFFTLHMTEEGFRDECLYLHNRRRHATRADS